MFTTISWGNYIIAIGTLLLVWYLFLGFRFYSYELKQILLGQSKIKFPLLGGKNKIDPNLKWNGNEIPESNLSASFSESFATLDEVKELSTRLISAVNESAERNLSRQEFKNYLKLILDEYPYVKISSLRATINQLIASECEKHPEITLAFSEVDELWEESI